MERRLFLKIAGSTMLSMGLPMELLAYAGKNESVPDEGIRDVLLKSKLFNRKFKDDIWVDSGDMVFLKSTLLRLKRVQKTVGHGNFCLLGFDDSIRVARNYSYVGSFTKKELAFLEKVFYEQGDKFGFMGEKTMESLTFSISSKGVTKIPRTGNYLYKGDPLTFYKKIQKTVGDNVILTSGVRSVTKQFLLFLNKAYRSNGNLSMASRSLAPPGYSFHGIGDFDVGLKGFGVANFTEKFVDTDIYKKLVDLGYVKFRYARNNELGVRFEPWHIKVV